MPAKRPFFLPVFIALFLQLVLAFQGTIAPATAAESRPLLTIGETTYTGDDFLTWWRLWKEQGMTFPETPTPYIDWLLQVREAELMELYRRPTYQAKVDTYLQARSLLLLRQEEVEDRIKNDEDTLYRHYVDQFTPRWQIIPRFFNSMEEALAWTKSDSAVSDVRQKDPHVQVMGRWYRPTTLPAPWKETLATMTPGHLSAPIASDGKVAILELIDHQGPDKEDFQTVRQTVEESSYKRQKQELTSRLLDRLMGKYQVVINQELLQTIDLTADNGAIGDQILVTTARTSLTVADFVAMATKNRPMIVAKDSDADRKERMVNNILAHNLVNWDALDRHYENIPPFSENYRFYKGHRLVRELEAVVIRPLVKVEKESVDKYYQDNIKKYEGAIKVSYATVEADASTIKEIWVDVLQGENFLASCKKITGNEATSRSDTTDRLPSDIAPTIAKLAVGELSRPIQGEQGRSRLVWLADRVQMPSSSLENVRPSIEQTLTETAMAEARSGLLADLKKRISIHIEENTWNSIHQQYSGK